jgi:SAM-dependent methyltransferase
MGDNAQQISDWNGEIGLRWAQNARDTEDIVKPFGEAAIAAAGASTGERVLDIGCGAGATSMQLARQVGAVGLVLGVDVSRPLLELARVEAGRHILPQLAFLEADASTAELPGDINLAFSRFGVMFFDEPVPAFAHMRHAMAKDGRLVFVCWRAPRENPWAMTPVVAAREALGVTPEPMDPNSPGPFAFADPDRIQSILKDAGFAVADIAKVDADLRIGANAGNAAERSLRIGPASRVLRDAGEEHRERVTPVVAKAFERFAREDGVYLPGAVWLVTARNR